MPKSDPQLDISPWLLPPGAVSGAFDAQHTFGRQAALEIDVGCGKGLFVCTAAAARPGDDFLGVEVIAKYARFAASRLARLKIPNARIVQGDAKSFLKTVPRDRVAAVHVYFPDPWWKKRHRRRRVMCEEFIAQVEAVLQPGGRLHFWTDVQEYFQSSVELVGRVSQLEGPIAVAPDPALHDMDYRTHFERRVRLNHLPVYRAEFLKPTWHLEIAVGWLGAGTAAAAPTAGRGPTEPEST